MWSLGRRRLANGMASARYSREESRIHCTGMDGYFRAHVFNAHAVLEASQKMPMRAHSGHETGAGNHKRGARRQRRRVKSFSIRKSNNDSFTGQSRKI